MTGAEQIIAIFKKHGHQAYGEGCSVNSHSIQSGLSARDKGYDEALILAAFLHDIGHLSPLEQETQYVEMGGLGIDAHDRWGEKYLASFGFSPRIIAPVKNHVASKRYLCFIDANYYDQLSQASKGTLAYQGGIMNAREATAFEKDPFFEESILIRKIDDEAKANNFSIIPAHWIYFSNLITSHLN